ncbi:MAG: magnesium transporter [Candidatus Tectomicrobia bacterium]|nr:magnesium transporter [Candidatus Tectomicrobia bacterium]
MRQGSRQPLSPTASRILPFDALNRLLQNESYPHLVRLLRPFHGSECAAMIASLTEREQCLLLENLPDRDLATMIMTYLDPGTRSDLLPLLSTGFMVEMVHLLPRDDAVDILAEIPAARLAEIREHLPADIAAEIDSLLTHDAESAGGLMTTQYLALEAHMTVAAAIDAIRQAEQAETVFYIYVVDEVNRLVGVLSLRQLVLADPETPLHQLMERDVVSVDVDEDQEQIAHVIMQYDFLALPVVDRAGSLVGIVTVDDLIDVIREETTEDLLRLAGVSPDAMLEAPARDTIRHRLPWLFISWLGGLLASYVIDAHHDTLQRVAMLAAFFPVIIGMGGNTATQSLAVAIRNLATDPRTSPSFMQAFLKEGGAGLALGVIYGVLLGSVAFVWHQSIAFGLVAAIAIWASMTVAALLGGLLPLLFARVRIDPAVASGPFLTTAIDIIGLLLYLATARLLLLS